MLYIGEIYYCSYSTRIVVVIWISTQIEDSKWKAFWLCGGGGSRHGVQPSLEAVELDGKQCNVLRAVGTQMSHSDESPVH